MNRTHEDALTDLLVDNLTKNGSYWSKHGFTGTVQNPFEKLSKQNPYNAVVSAKNEEHEKKKSEEVVTLLTEKLKDGVVLDLGCGYGRLAKYLLPRRPMKGYIGLDSSPNMLNLFFERHNKTPQEQETPLLLIYSEIDTIPLKDSSVDNVVVSAVFLHNHKSIIKKSLSEIRRVLKPGGNLFVFTSFPNKFTAAGIQGVVYLWALTLFGKAYNNGPVRYFSKSEVATLFDGFSKKEITPSGFFALPTKILFFPTSLNRVYRKNIVNPINSVLRELLPQSMQDFFCVHHNVIAQK